MFINICEQEIDGVENLTSDVKRITYAYSCGFYAPTNSERELYYHKFKRDETVGKGNTLTAYKRSRVLKDLDFLQDGERIIVGEKIKRAYCNQLRTDLDFLIAMNVMDYSLLVGIHHLDMKRKQNTLASTKPKRMRPGNLFTFEFGGMCAEKIMVQDKESTIKDPMGSWMMNKKKNIYFTGIIDFLQKYNTKKMMESYYKRSKHGVDAISSVDAKTYANRLYEFIARRID
jgi:hypothetical protein